MHQLLIIYCSISKVIATQEFARSCLSFENSTYIFLLHQHKNHRLPFADSAMLPFHFKRQRSVLCVCYIHVEFPCCILFYKFLLSREEDSVLFLCLCVLKITTLYISRITLDMQGDKIQNYWELPPVLTARNAQHNRCFCLKYLKITSEIPSFVFYFSPKSDKVSNSQIYKYKSFFFFQKQPIKKNM